MVNLWVRFERKFGLVVTFGMEDGNTAGSWKLELEVGKGWFQVRASQKDDFGGEYNYRQYYVIRNPISEGSNGDSDHEDSSALGNPILQMGECSTSDYRQEIPQDNPTQQDSGISGSQILPLKDHSGADDDYRQIPQNPVSGDSSDDAWLKANKDDAWLEELFLSDDQASPWNPFPAVDSIQMGEPFAYDYHQEIPKSDPDQLDSGTSGYQILPVKDHSSGDDDYQGSPQNPVSDDNSDDARLKSNLELLLSDYQPSPWNPFPVGASIQMGEPFACDYHQEIPKSDPDQLDSGTSGYQILPVKDHSGGDDDYQGSPQNPVSDDSSDDAWLKSNSELFLPDYEASPWNPFPVGASMQMWEALVYDYRQEIPESDPAQLDSGASGSPSLSVEVHSSGDDDYLVSPQNAVSDDFSDVAWLKAHEKLSLSDDQANPSSSDSSTYPLAGLTRPGENVSYYSGNVPRSELSGEVAGMNIDEVRCDKTGSDGVNLFMGAENAMSEVSPSGTANILNALDDLGGSAVAAESEIPQGPSSGNRDEENDDNKTILN